MIKKLALLIILAAVVVLWLAPIGPMPGFFIGGTVIEAPDTWEDTSAVDEVRLKVEGLIPRVVIIWVVEVDGELYVTGDKQSGWVKGLENGGDAHLRIGENTYPVVAEPQTENVDKLISAWYEKYQPNYPEIVGQMREVSVEPRPYQVFKLARL